MSIDAVLHAAGERGAVPNVVAVAADDRGVIYEGAAGPLARGGFLRAQGRSRPGGGQSLHVLGGVH